MRQFYTLEDEDHKKTWAESCCYEHQYDFLRDDLYKQPLEYPYMYEMRNGVFKDYTGTDAHPIFSKKFRDIINEFVPKDKLEWIHIKVKDKDGTIKDAYVPRFIPKPHMFEVLNEELTVLTDLGELMVPRLSTEKTKDKHFIRLFENSYINYVSEDLKKAIQKAKLTGVKFEKVKMYP